MPGDDLGVLLEEAKDLLRSRYLLAFVDTTHRLIDAPLNQRHEVLQALHETKRLEHFRLFSQLLCDALSLGAATAGDPHKFAVGFPEFFGGLLAFTERYSMELLRNAPDAAVASTKGFFTQTSRVFFPKELLRAPQQAADDPHTIT